MLDGRLHDFEQRRGPEAHDQHGHGQHAQDEEFAEVEILSSATWWLATSPKMTRLTSHNVYAAPRISVTAARNAYQNWP